jgi:hypothetical protein
MFRVEPCAASRHLGEDRFGIHDLAGVQFGGADGNGIANLLETIAPRRGGSKISTLVFSGRSIGAVGRKTPFS